MRRRTGLAIVAAMPLLTAGCAWLVAGTAVGAGAYLWYKGWLQATLTQPIERVFPAAKLAARDLQIETASDSLEGSSGSIDGYLPDGRRVVIRLKSAGPGETRVSIRVGLWGDQETSLRLLERLRKHM